MDRDSIEIRTEAKADWLGGDRNVVFLQIHKWVYPKGSEWHLALANTHHEPISLEQAKLLKESLEVAIAEAEVSEMA
jgi:hypothetical protein